jgi:hypothetical protein
MCLWIVLSGEVTGCWDLHYLMGGHALSPGLTERKCLHEYLRIKQLVLDRLSLVPEQIIHIATVTEVPEKEEFGDLDLIFYRLDGVSEYEVKAFVQNIFSPHEIFQCGNVTSFDFEHFQIDFIECERATFDLTRFCLSYGDRGMILGQIARWNGFSLGFQGLVITTEDLEAICEIKGLKEKVLLTIDPTEVRKLMGLPLDDDLIGSSRHDVGLFCKQSPWYRPEIFTNKLNSEGRKRWAKRPYYRYFVEQIIAETVTHYNLLLKQEQHREEGEPDPFLSHRLQEHLYHHIHSSHDITSAYHSIHPLPLDEEGTFYTSTPTNLQKEQRLSQIRKALTVFDKWNEIEEIQRRHLLTQQRREKLNYNHFLELGIPSDQLIAARAEFLHWLKGNKSSQTQTATEAEGEGEGDVVATSETSEMPLLVPGERGGTEETEVELLDDETIESMRLKLLLWKTKSPLIDLLTREGSLEPGTDQDKVI